MFRFRARFRVRIQGEARMGSGRLLSSAEDAPAAHPELSWNLNITCRTPGQSQACSPQLA